jgi:murein DD-endopeptidase MepM/ murein hydrolase activator NlpD
MRYLLIIPTLFIIFSCSQPFRYSGEHFSFAPAGALDPVSSGTGRAGDQYIYAPGIRFPLESAPAYINSQVYGIGGLYGPRGSLCSAGNYQYPWRDNYCERRGWKMPLCPAGKGHQGVDIRPATCERRKHWAVAVEQGVITSIGAYTIYLRGSSGRIYRYLHLDSQSLQVHVGQRVRRGQRIGLVSDNMGSTKTSIHLHFDMKQTIRFNNGQSAQVYVPPYTSLVNAYQRLLRGNP